MADNVGLRESFRAYTFHKANNGPERSLPGLENFTPEQIFFLSFAQIWCSVETPEHLASEIMSDPHSPFRYRAIGPLSNSADFIQAFNCSASASMNRADKCVLW